MNASKARPSSSRSARSRGAVNAALAASISSFVRSADVSNLGRLRPPS
jgi:hypothetical protein